MPSWLLYTVASLFFVLLATALFFFTVTRGALLMRGVMSGSQDDAAHVYPIYSNLRLIRMIDFQPIIAAILLFQYDRLVSAITHGLQHMNLRGKNVLITSCAFGNVIPRVVNAAIDTGARRVLIADIIKNELDHAQGKLLSHAGKIEFMQENAIAMKQADNSVSANVIFFLLHELPHHLKGQPWREEGRVFEPGGKL